MGTQRPGAVLAVCSLATFLAFLDVTILNIAFPAISRSFDSASLADLSWVFSAYNVVFAALLIPAGRAADLYGRRRVFVTGLALFAVASAACAFAPTAALLVGARVLQAAAAAMLVPASLALLLPAFPPERRGAAIGTWGAMGGIAAATGPALGGLLVEVFGWRAVFLVNLPIVALTLVIALRVLAESRGEGVGLPDALSVLLLGSGVALVSLGIVSGEGGSWVASATLAPLVGGVVLVALFAWRGRRVPNPLVAPELFAVRSFSAAVLGYLVFSGGFYALLLSNVLFMTGVWAYPTLLAGVAVTPGPIMAAVGSTVGGRISDRFGARASIVPGALLFALGCLLFATRVGPEPAYLAVFLPATLLNGAGVGLVYSGLATASVARLPAAHFATGSAVGTCARQIGAVLGIAVLLSALAGSAELGTFRAGWWVMTATALLTVGCGLAVGRTRAPALTIPAPRPVVAEEPT
ncbi:DHA2 family efflux MFS transporter permease subunit [Pseudonocardia humida]|uniref:DHA2 family efflux MFS transporter permease subunit n=1 Tax=Pseudonocardia humida TaxID=2800819 RepID=A0ABT0ZT15_9PSEU|nr:DHA2 family efflux MFS transporter permease subunit [Pseudonocardia humida]MCO1653859.1 DHA2 family efflux MFS transporter permease subunit [Pseudonocardia humida]